MKQCYYFSISIEKFFEKESYYNEIEQKIEKNGYIKSFDLRGELKKVLQNYKKKKINYIQYKKALYEVRSNIVKVIRSSDLILADATTRSLVVGIDIGVAMTFGVPTLIIEDLGGEDQSYRKVVEYMNKKTPYLHSIIYSCQKDLRGLDKTIRSIQINFKKERVHLLLESYLNKYLNWKTKHSVYQNKTEIIKSLITQEMKKDNIPLDI